MIRNFCIDVMITIALFGIVWGAAPVLALCLCEDTHEPKCASTEIISSTGNPTIECSHYGKCGEITRTKLKWSTGWFGISYPYGVASVTVPCACGPISHANRRCVCCPKEG